MTDRIDTAAERAKLAALEGHTPGPWRQTPQDYVVSSGAGLALPRVAIADDAGGISDVTANARIIAAAPDMKATLAAALDEIDRLREALQPFSDAADLMVDDMNRRQRAMQGREPDLVEALEAENQRLRATLEQIAIQKRTDELVTVLDVEFADFEDGYDLCIDCARKALAPTDSPVDWGAPVRTLEGNPARVVCTDYKGSDGRCEHPILAVVTYPEGLEVIGAYTREGKHHLCYTGEMDLINRAEEEAVPTGTPQS